MSSEENHFNGDEVVPHPISRQCLDHMFEQGLDYGMSWKVEFFERELRCKRDAPEFWRGMLEVQKGVYERFKCHYLKKSGELYTVVEAWDNEKVAKRDERQMRTKGRRAIDLRQGTLANQKAKLTEDQRLIMSRNQEVATMRFALMARTMQVVKVVRKNAPKLLGEQTPPIPPATEKGSDEAPQ